MIRLVHISHPNACFLAFLEGTDFFAFFSIIFFIYIIVETMTISLLVAKSHLIVVIDDLVHVFVLLLCFGKSSHLGSLKWPEKTRKNVSFWHFFEILDFFTKLTTGFDENISPFIIVNQCPIFETIVVSQCHTIFMA